jgi:hypothetical protein
LDTVPIVTPSAPGAARLAPRCSTVGGHGRSVRLALDP